jgi:hypothetical protein
MLKELEQLSDTAVDLIFNNVSFYLYSLIYTKYFYKIEFYKFLKN